MSKREDFADDADSTLNEKPISKQKNRNYSPHSSRQKSIQDFVLGGLAGFVLVIVLSTIIEFLNDNDNFLDGVVTPTIVYIIAPTVVGLFNVLISKGK